MYLSCGRKYVFIFVYFVFIIFIEEVFSNEDEVENMFDIKNKKLCFEDILIYWLIDVVGLYIWDE